MAWWRRIAPPVPTRWTSIRGGLVCWPFLPFSSQWKYSFLGGLVGFQWHTFPYMRQHLYVARLVCDTPPVLCLSKRYLDKLGSAETESFSTFYSLLLRYRNFLYILSDIILSQISRSAKIPTALDGCMDGMRPSKQRRSINVLHPPDTYTNQPR